MYDRSGRPPGPFPRPCLSRPESRVPRPPAKDRRPLVAGPAEAEAGGTRRAAFGTAAPGTSEESR